MSQMRVIMLHTPDYQPSDISVPVTQSYCKQWGYPFDYYEDVISHEWIPSWNKILAVQTVMRRAVPGEYLTWIDGDILILRQDLPLDSLIIAGKDLAFSTDIHGICSGFFIIRKCPAMEKFMRDLWFHYCTCWPWEQGAMKALIKNDFQLQEATAHISPSLIQNPRTEFNANAFAMHYWANHFGCVRTKRYMSLAVQQGWKEEVFPAFRHRVNVYRKQTP